MSSALKTITSIEYLARERKAEFKSEFLHGEMFAMAGGSPMRSLIAANFVGSAWQALKGKPCKVFNSDLRVKVSASGLYTYPDASIICGELKFDDIQQDTVINPTVLIEVLSDSTEKYDRGTKSQHYRSIESLQELVLISQNEAHVERYLRQNNGWLLSDISELQACLELSSIGVSMTLGELYRGVTFPLPETDTTSLEQSANQPS